MHWRRRLTIGPDEFGTLLFFLLASLITSGVDSSEWPKVFGSLANLGALVAGFAASGIGANRLRLGVLATIGIVSTVLVSNFEQTSVAAGLAALGQAFVLAAILLAVVRRVLSHDEVGVPTIAGAIAAYFLIGMVFAWLYLAAHGLLDPPILDPESTALPSYYSFVVLSTLGFGDVSPINDLVRQVTAIEAVTGQIFLATLVARLVAMFGSTRRRAADEG